MDSQEIRAIVVAEKAAAIGSSSTSDLTKQRADALDYYLGDLTDHMPVAEGQSKACSTDVSDVIETIMPSLMDIFTSGEDYCEFAPQGPEDEEAAQQETDYVNHVFMNENPGFMILYTQIKDALLSKNGIVKAWVEENESVEKETYRNLDEGAYSVIAADTEVEIIEQTETVDEYGQPRFDVVVTKTKTYKCIKVEAVPPEEFGIAQRAKTIQSSPYCYHRYQRTPSDLIEQGYDRKVVEGLPTGTRTDEEESEARDTFRDESEATSSINKATRLIDVTEHYVRIDMDGDGIAELVKVVTAGGSDTLLGKPEEFDRMPFHSITPYPMPHRFFGRSVADLTIDIMRIKTHLLRAVLDNASLLNNQRIAVGEQGASENTLDDLLTNRPGGIVRMRDVTQLREIPNQQLGGHILPLMEYVDQLRETRTGITRTAGGIDPNVLNKAASTATGFQGLLDQSMMRIKLIARIFAETGIKDLFLHIHELARKHQDERKLVRLRNKWVPVDPRDWKTRNDMSVTVALGSGSKAQQLLFLDKILERQIQGVEFQGGADGPLVTLTNIHNTVKRMTELAGFKNASLYFNEPPPTDPNAPSEPPPDPKLIEAQGKLQAMQAQMELDRQKAELSLQLERDKGEAKIAMEREKAAMQADLARQKAEAEFALAQAKAEQEYELAQQKMALEAEISAMRAEIEAETARETAEVQLSTNRPGGDLSE